MKFQSLILLGTFSLVNAGGPSFYPCAPDKWLQKDGVTCSSVQLPYGLCSSCNLNEPAFDGKFKDCQNIYNKNGACVSKMNEYVKHNTCDKRRSHIMNKINGGNANWIDWASLDYFLYSVCEMCCDSIPMGASSNDAGKWVTDRGNSPAHAFYDICSVLPNVKYFRNIGDPENSALENGPTMCTELNNWFNSPHSNNWQTNPKTTISSALHKSTVALLNSIECSSSNVWNACFNLEKKQNNLGQEGTFNGEGDSNDVTSETGSGSGSTSNQCQGQIKWTCLKSKTIQGKFCCQQPGCKCVPGPINKEPEQGCYEHGGIQKPGVGYDVSNCSGNVRWGCLETLYDGPGCKWTCKKWGCQCFPFEPKTSDPSNSCLNPATTKQSEEGITLPPKKSSASCFPDSAMVTSNNGPVAMARLKIGDVVMVKPGVFSPVYMFSHHDGGASTLMMQIKLHSGNEITLSPGHHVLTNVKEVSANELRRGMTIQGVNGREIVQSINLVQRTGLYNPHTLSGTIVVDGIICSTYTRHVQYFAAHALLSPLRMLWKSGLSPISIISSFFQYGASGRL